MALQLLALKKKGLWSLLVLAVILVLAATLNWHHSSICPDHSRQCLEGYDIDTYVALTVNGSYEGWGGRHDITVNSELPGTFWLLRLNPLRLAGEWLGFRGFMLAFTVFSGLLAYGFLVKTHEETVFYGLMVWLFNPLNYRLFLDFTQNLVVNVLGLAALVFIVNKKRWSAVFLVFALFFVHELAVFWLAVALVYWLKEEWVVYVIAWFLFWAGYFMHGGWRLWMMLPFCMMVVACSLPPKHGRVVAVLMFITYLFSPWLFSGQP